MLRLRAHLGCLLEVPLEGDGWMGGKWEQQGMDVALAVTRGAAVGSGTTKFWEGRRSRKSCYKKTVSRCP